MVFRSPFPVPDVLGVTRRDSSSDPWASKGPHDPQIDRLVDRSVDSILAASADGASGSLLRALFETLRGFPSVQSATLWQARHGARGMNGQGTEWHHLRSLGSPTPDPSAACGPTWTVPGFSVLQAAPFGTLVVETALSAHQEVELNGIECLLSLCTSLFQLEASPEQPMLEDVGAALPKSPPRSTAVDPSTDARVHSSEVTRAPSPAESDTEPVRDPDLGDAAA